jgi:hypothetical protein
VKARDDLATTVERAERDIDKTFAPHVKDIGDSVRRNAVNGKITASARAAIMRDVDGILDALYGPKKGSPSPIERLVVGRSQEIERKPIADEVDRIEQFLAEEPTLLARMKQG